ILDPRLVDLDHLTHRVTLHIVRHHIAPSEYQKKPSVPKVRKILYVIRADDEPDGPMVGVRALAATALRRAGYRVLVAEDGEAALARLDADDGRIDALITDVMMPGMDGRELARLVADRLGEIPVVLMSGCADEATAAASAASPSAW
ncbi:MAG TPA: response regulator, partial [Rhodospirillales bacterium]|nr:response regulator [Rhodospirillales bacterium]